MTEPTQQDLKACPSCNGKAKLDTTQGYRALRGGRLGNRCVIYCLKCSFEAGFCHKDWDGDFAGLIHYIVEMWNTRAYEAEIQALKIQLGKCIIQEREADPAPYCITEECSPENYTEEKALAAYQEWS